MLSSVSDSTDADRGLRSRRASSPKWVLGPRVATFLPLRVTAAVPLTMMKNSVPIRPSSTSTLPGGTVSSSSEPRIFLSSDAVQLENSQMFLSSRALALRDMEGG